MKLSTRRLASPAVGLNRAGRLGVSTACCLANKCGVQLEGPFLAVGPSILIAASNAA